MGNNRASPCGAFEELLLAIVARRRNTAFVLIRSSVIWEQQTLFFGD